MIYDVRLKVSADYPDTVKEARHALRMRLRRRHGQDVIAEALRISPTPDETVTATDFFGNICDHVTILKQHETMEVELRARVAIAPPEPDLSRTPSVAKIAAAAAGARDAGPASPIHFRGASRLLSPTAETLEFARDVFAGPSVGEAALAMTEAIRADFTYVPGETDIDTPVDEVLRTRRGVCQDFAHLMIAALRSLQIPAAYVSGFLRTEPPPGRPRLEGADAMHAWVSVWLGGEAGWVGFDPTNGVVARTDHIVVAIGRDYADVAPVGGVIRTSGGQETRHEVDVVPIEEAEAAADKNGLSRSPSTST